MEKYLKDAYAAVFTDLCQCRLFQGYYDAINGSEQYMCGIETVMEVIANRGYDDEFAERFSDIFAFNMNESKQED